MPESSNSDLSNDRHSNESPETKKFKDNFPFWIFPLIGAAVWFSMLWSLMIIWLSQRQPRYSHMKVDQRVAYISDIGANVLKPFFVAGCTITAVMFSASLFSVRYNHALVGDVERLYDNISIGAGVIGSIGQISLSIFDLAHHHDLHFFCLLVFMIGVALSAVSTVYEYNHLGKKFEDFEILRVIYFVKISLIVIEVCLSILMAGSLLGKWYLATTCTEWGLLPHLENNFWEVRKLTRSRWVASAYVYTFYLLSYFFDLGPLARTKDQEKFLRELNAQQNPPSNLSSIAETTSQES